MPNIYQFDTQRRLWHRAKPDTFAYSDGDVTENRLLAVLRTSQDISSSSEELRAAINDWPSEYHLSSVRHNLLRPFDLGPGQRILELGCGCGAMTRYLGETGATVVAVEGSLRRAEIAAERCRDLGNVSIYCDNLIQYEPEGLFDVVTLIGVLEYAPCFIASEDPVGACLAAARQFLKPDGALILAIENQLGLKYFNGCGEDHVGEPYFGIQDRYGTGMAITFGHRELDDRLARAGFCLRRFHYPFPDYKLPSLIIAQEALETSEMNLDGLLYAMESRDRTGKSMQAFSERMAWAVVARNDLVADLANSFLVVASRNEVPSHALEGSPWLAVSCAVERHPAYATITRIESASLGAGLHVKKTRLYPGLPAAKATLLSHQPSSAPYLQGRLLITDFQRQMIRSKDVGILAAVLRPWAEHLKRLRGADTRAMAPIPGDCLDLVPRNVLVQPGGGLSFFDQEWSWNETVPLGWVALRGVTDCVLAGSGTQAWQGYSVGSLASAILVECGITLESADIERIAVLEEQFQTLVHARANYVGLQSALATPLGRDAYFHRQVSAFADELSRIKNTWSWKITKPLRLIANLPGIAWDAWHGWRK
jgi:2-polyprenyl-3-methyl-5-hydroxy-6-metoxy-1,4-benzoquinol methylase